jgi:hypothetical protein
MNNLTPEKSVNTQCGGLEQLQQPAHSVFRPHIFNLPAYDVIVNIDGALRGLRHPRQLSVVADTVGEDLADKVRAGKRPLVRHATLVQAAGLYEYLKPLVISQDKTVIAISGCATVGKSSLAAVLGSLFSESGHSSYVMGTNNYVSLDPLRNEAKRIEIYQSAPNELCAYLGSDRETDFNRLDQIVDRFRCGESFIPVRIMNLHESSVSSEALLADFSGTRLLILEGTWAGYVEGVDRRLFFKGDPGLTLAARAEGGSYITEFHEYVLSLEADRLQQLKAHCEIVVENDGTILKQEEGLGFEPAKPRDLRAFQSVVAIRETTERQPVLPVGVAPDYQTVDSEVAVEKAKQLIRANIHNLGILADSSQQQGRRELVVRDAVITGLAALLIEDKPISEALRVSLETFVTIQDSNGQVPVAMVVGSPDEQQVEYSAALDPSAWLVIGVCNYAALTKDEKKFARKMREPMQKALALMRLFDTERNQLLSVGPGADWAARYHLTGNVLTPNLLRLWALQAYAGLDFLDSSERQEAISAARRIRTAIEVNFWPDKANLGRPEVVYPLLYKSYLDAKGEPSFFRAALSLVRGYSEQFDYFGCALATLLKLGSEKQRQTQIDYALELIKRNNLGIAGSFTPPVFPGQPEYVMLENIAAGVSKTGAALSNKPFTGFNGGLWPMTSGWWTLVLAENGRTTQAQDLLEHLNHFNCNSPSANSWGFPEHGNALNGQPGAKFHKSWSAAASLLGSAALSKDKEKKRLLFNNPD